MEEIKGGLAAAEGEQLNRFWRLYKKQTISIAFLSQGLIITLIVFILLIIFPSPPVGAWALIVVVAFIAMTISIFTTLFLLKPLRDLSRALVHVTGEPTNDSAPNLNDKYYATIGLRPLLKTIYELASTQPSSGPFLGHSTTNSAAATFDPIQGLNNTKTGVVMLNVNKEIVFANKNAPVKEGPNGKKELQLVFDVEQTIGEWLSERGEHDIHAEHTWRRVANKLTGESERRIYDVFVSFEKGSEAETIITLFDRTDEYQPEDDDLDFIAFAAHELRGPITVIRGYLDTLNDELTDITSGDQKELFNRLIVSANRLSGYVNNILNASRFDRRHLKIHLNEMTIATIYDSIADDMKLRAEAQARLLSVDFPPTLPTVAADLNSMSEVLGNLIDNAIKYSNEGGSIEVTADTNGDFVDVSVTDHGIGMPANVIQNLFHKFYRSHRSRETVAGTGIGLYISKAIVESNGGKISVRSVEGRGSTFTFSLPIYSTVADKLKASTDNNQEFIEKSSSGWIKNHGAIRG